MLAAAKVQFIYDPLCVHASVVYTEEAKFADEFTNE